MPFDVRMPDGTVIRNVPDGTSKADIQERYKMNRAREAASKHPVAGPILSGVANFADQLTLGFGDEISATLDTLNPLSGRPNVWRGDGFGSAWRQNQQARDATARQYSRDNPKTAIAGSIAGAFLPGMAGGVGAVRTASNAPRLARSARAVAPAAAQGAAYGFGSTNGDIADRAKGAGKGAAYGVAGDVAGRAVGRGLASVVGGKAVPKNVRTLAREGVVMTPGQRAGVGSIRNVFEDKVLGSIPFVSDVPAAARNRGVNDLRVAVANRVLAPLGENVPRGTHIGNEAISGIQGRVYGALDNAAGNLSLGADEGLAQGFDAVRQASPRMLGAEGAQQVNANIAHLDDMLSRGPISGDTLRETLGELRGLASNDKGQLGQQIWALHDNLVDAMGRQNPADALAAFNKAREATALLKRMESAASKSVDGEFGPTQLLQAARQRGYGTSTANVASGEARLMDLANAAADVMRNTTANSGTPARAMAGALGLSGGVGATSLVSPVGAAAVSAPLLGYVPGIDKILQDMALKRSDNLIRAGDRIRGSNIPNRLGLGGALGLFSLAP